MLDVHNTTNLCHQLYIVLATLATKECHHFSPILTRLPPAHLLIFAAYLPLPARYDPHSNTMAAIVTDWVPNRNKPSFRFWKCCEKMGLIKAS